MHDDAKYQAALAELKARGPARCSWWRHRNGGRYLVLYLCVIEATLTPAVGYASEMSGPTDPLWVRPLDEFLDGRFTLEAKG